VQAMLQSMVQGAFTPASGLGVMPAMPILAAKNPRAAAHVVPDAPMQRLRQFYISNVAEEDLEPLVAVTSRERAPAAVEVRELRSLSCLMYTSTCMLPLRAMGSQGSDCRPLPGPSMPGMLCRPASVQVSLGHSCVAGPCAHAPM
jgi:hypothetical protein